MLEPQTLRFLKQLKANNNKEWFDLHRSEYEAARIDFTNFIQLVIHELEKTDPDVSGLSAKDCTFRIFRDVRFSNDKTPYKTNFGASIKKGGRKSPYAGYYFHCEPGGSFAGGGIWMPDAASLKKLRQEIDYNWDGFQAIIGEKTFTDVYGSVYFHPDISLNAMPRGYDKQHPAADFLRLKSLIAEKTFSDKELTQSSLHRKTIEAFGALKPLLDFINASLD